MFEIIPRNDLTEQENKRAMESLIFQVQNRFGKIKGRTDANGSTQRAYINRDDAESPTAASYYVIVTGVI